MITYLRVVLAHQNLTHLLVHVKLMLGERSSNSVLINDLDIEQRYEGKDNALFGEYYQGVDYEQTRGLLNGTHSNGIGN